MGKIVHDCFREVLINWLKTYSLELGQLYEGALKIVSQDNFPGKVRLVSHAVREIFNRLPDEFSGIIIQRIEYDRRLNELCAAWEQHDPLASPIAIKSYLDQATPVYPMATPVVYAFAVLLSDHKANSNFYREKAYEFFNAIASADQRHEYILNPVVNNWCKLQKWFAGHAHSSRKTVNLIEETQKLDENFKAFESILQMFIPEGKLSRRFIETLGELDGMLEDANRIRG